MCANNIWDTIFSGLTALGTIGACVISLLLAHGKYKHRLDCVFIWGAPNDYKPTLLVNNLCSRTIVINEIKVFYNRKRIAVFDFLEDFALREFAIISAESKKNIYLDADEFEFDTLNISETGKEGRKKKLRIVVKTSSNKRFISKQKYSTDEIYSLLIGHGLLGSD